MFISTSNLSFSIWYLQKIRVKIEKWLFTHLTISLVNEISKQQQSYYIVDKHFADKFFLYLSVIFVSFMAEEFNNSIRFSSVLESSVSLVFTYHFEEFRNKNCMTNEILKKICISTLEGRDYLRMFSFRTYIIDASPNQ